MGDTSNLRRRIALALAVALMLTLASSAGEPTADAALAARYRDYALEHIERGEWAAAEAVLERAQDWASSSSDLSWLLARARDAMNRPPKQVLSALRTALATATWNMDAELQCREREAELLLRLRDWDGALAALARLPEGPQAAVLTLRAMAGKGAPRLMPQLEQALHRWPAHAPLAVFAADYFTGRKPTAQALELVELIRRSLDVYLPQEPDLAWKVAPLLPNREEAARLVAAYRAAGAEDPRSLPLAVEFGLIDEGRAIDILFAGEEPLLDLAVLRSLYRVLRSKASRAAMAARLASFTATVVQDLDRDGWVDQSADYENGALMRLSCDPEQDGEPSLLLTFRDGLPYEALVGGAADDNGGLTVTWQRYPFVSEVRAHGLRYLAVPSGFAWAPVTLRPVLDGESSSAQWPVPDPRTEALTLRRIVSSSRALVRPGLLAPQSREQVELDRGVPVRSMETVGERLIARTAYRQGRPVSREWDVDQDGRFETRQRASRPLPDTLEGSSVFEADYSESDWNGDGKIEYIERRLGDGRIEIAIDADLDGHCESISIEAEGIYN